MVLHASEDHINFSRGGLGLGVWVWYGLDPYARPPPC